MKYKAILFDFDDTLVQTKKIRYEALKYTAKTFYTLTITDEDIDRYWGKPFHVMMDGVFNSVDTTENLSANYKSILHLYPNLPFEDTLTTLDSLSNQYILGLISSSVRELITSGLKDVGISPDLFKYIQTSDEIEYHKPDPRVFNPVKDYLLKQSIKESEVLYVGDTLDDYISSRDAGFGFIGIAGRTTDSSIFKDNGAEYVDSLAELLKRLG